MGISDMMRRGKFEDTVDLHVRILAAQEKSIRKIALVTNQTKSEIVGQALQLWINSNKDLIGG